MPFSHHSNFNNPNLEILLREISGKFSAYSSTQFTLLEMMTLAELISDAELLLSHELGPDLQRSISVSTVFPALGRDYSPVSVVTVMDDLPGSRDADGKPDYSKVTLIKR